MLLRTENIAEDERFYKTISGLDDQTGQETIEHGNASPRKCEFKPLCLDEILRCFTIFGGGRLKFKVFVVTVVGAFFVHILQKLSRNFVGSCSLLLPGSLLRFDNLFFIQSLPSSSGTRWRRRTSS